MTKITLVVSELELPDGSSELLVTVPPECLTRGSVEAKLLARFYQSRTKGL